MDKKKLGLTIGLACLCPPAAVGFIAYHVIKGRRAASEETADDVTVVETEVVEQSENN